MSVKQHEASTKQVDEDWDIISNEPYELEDDNQQDEDFLPPNEGEISGEDIHSTTPHKMIQDSDESDDSLLREATGMNNTENAGGSSEILSEYVSVNSNLNRNGTKKRKYNFSSRKVKDRSGPCRQTKWIQSLESMTEAKLRRTTCCKQLKCFQRVDYQYFMHRSQQILSSCPLSRRASLQAMQGSDNQFFFNGKRVCTRFLKNAFRFSTVLMGKDHVPTSDLSKTCQSPNHMSVQSSQVVATSTYTSSSSSLQFRYSPQKDSIISFLLRLSEDCSERMPDKNEYHLPFFQKREVYSHFLSEFKRLYKSEPPSPHYFLTVWKSNCRHIKVRRSSRFTVCDTCEQLRATLRETVLKGGDTSALKARTREHLKMVSDERMEYQMKRDRTRLEPSSYCSVIVDGADQSSYGLPHFTTKTKSTKGESLKVHLIGALEHNVENILHLFTMTQEHQTGSNHIVETVHRFINDRRKRGPLPPNLFIQVDICTRENKNQYFMAYMEYLVASSVFQSVEVGFLPIGHTHEDIDQSFSQTSGQLSRTNAITLSDLHSVVSVVNHGRTRVSHMKRIANWKDLCDLERCIRRIQNISQYRYFKFSRSFSEQDTPGGPIVSTRCHVKLNCYNEWRELFPSKPGTPSLGILKFCPDLRKTPQLKICCPDGIDVITKRFQSEEGRINNTEKMIDLYELRDFVFKARIDSFHWDLEEAVETEQIRKNRRSSLNEEDIEDIQPQQNDSIESNVTHNRTNHNLQNQPSSSSIGGNNGIDDVDRICPESAEALNSKSVKHTSTATPISRVTYSAASFVAVRTEENGISNQGKVFWIGKVLSTENESGETYAKKLKVHWYDATSKEDPLSSHYHPCYNTAKKQSTCGSTKKVARRKLQQSFVDIIHTDTVIVSFQSLTKRHTLPLTVQKKLAS